MNLKQRQDATRVAAQTILDQITRLWLITAATPSHTAAFDRIAMCARHIKRIAEIDLLPVAAKKKKVRNVAGNRKGTKR